MTQETIHNETNNEMVMNAINFDFISNSINHILCWVFFPIMFPILIIRFLIYSVRVQKLNYVIKTKQVEDIINADIKK